MCRSSVVAAAPTQRRVPAAFFGQRAACRALRARRALQLLQNSTGAARFAAEDSCCVCGSGLRARQKGRCPNTPWRAPPAAERLPLARAGSARSCRASTHRRADEALRKVRRQRRRAGGAAGQRAAGAAGGRKVARHAAAARAGRAGSRRGRRRASGRQRGRQLARRAEDDGAAREPARCGRDCHASHGARARRGEGRARAQRGPPGGDGGDGEAPAGAGGQVSCPGGALPSRGAARVATRPRAPLPTRAWPAAGSPRRAEYAQQAAAARAQRAQPRVRSTRRARSRRAPAAHAPPALASASAAAASAATAASGGALVSSEAG
jgi:hypothetical protein